MGSQARCGHDLAYVVNRSGDPEESPHFRHFSKQPESKLLLLSSLCYSCRNHGVEMKLLPRRHEVRCGGLGCKPKEPDPRACTHLTTDRHCLRRWNEGRDPVCIPGSPGLVQNKALHKYLLNE